MRITATKWGNSLGVRIPRELALRVGVREGQKLEITVEDGQIVIVPVIRATDDDPFENFSEWDSEADRSAYRDL